MTWVPFLKLCLGFSRELTQWKSGLHIIKYNIKLCPRGTLGRSLGCSVFLLDLTRIFWIPGFDLHVMRALFLILESLTCGWTRGANR